MRDVVRGPWSVVRKAALCLFSFAVAAGGGAQTRVLDDFPNVAGWKVAPSQGVTLAVAGEAGPGGPTMRLHFDFQGHGGWAAVRKTVDLELPENYEFTFRIRGKAPSENLEFKLVDESGDNVWWSVRRDFAFPREWQTIRIKKRQISFAWGQAGGGEPTHVAAIELAITAGSGGKGSVWISDLALTSLPPDHPYSGIPVATASSSLAGRSPAQALTGEGGGWHSDPKATDPQWLSIDFGERREFGGLVIEWERPPGAFEALTSEDAVTWASAWWTASAQGGRSFVPMPEAETRFVRLSLGATAPEGVAIRRIVVQPLAFAATPNDFISSVAKDARRGTYPRAFLGEMTMWTLVPDTDPARPVGLLSADGAFEPAPRMVSFEPFVWLDGKLVTWADVTTTQSLLDGYLPIPTVTWHHPAFDLQITAFGGDGEQAGKTVRYRLLDRSGGPIRPRLLVAGRPFQVNPPSQFLSTPGGTADDGVFECAASGLEFRGSERWIGVAPSPGARCGTAAFNEGDIVSNLGAGVVPSSKRAGSKFPSAVLAWDLHLANGEPAERTVSVRDVAVAAKATPPAGSASAGSTEHVDAELDAIERRWHERLDRVEVDGPPDVVELTGTMKSNLAYILLSRDGPALRPGTRSYARSWIRDGAMMAAALLRLGHAEEVRDYLRWYAPYQFADGKVPCVVDSRGADPVAENDSHGELLFLAAEYLRYTRDQATVAVVWPQLEASVSYLEHLRQQRRTEAYRTPEKLALFGLLPESISHEGYSAKPMHSYWDDFWALKGFEDAAWLAKTLDHPEEAVRWAAIRDEFRRDLLASIARVRESKRLAFIPGCAELGDFDATSTTVALWPAGADADLPRAAVEATFERYWREAEARFTGNAPWEAYTPYEWRSVGALVRLGWRDRAVHLARWLMADRMPIGWSQWPEVVHHDRTKAAFLGDLPHAWVGSDFIRSFLDMLAFERSSDNALVLGAGVPAEWLAGDGIGVRQLRTPHGELSFTMQSEADAVHVRVEAGLRVPSGGLVLRPPLPSGPLVATVDGAKAAVSTTGEVIVRSLPADIVIRPQGASTVAVPGHDDKGRR